MATGYSVGDRVLFLRHRMDKDTFRQRLDEATANVIAHTRTLVTNHLPDDVRYLLLHNEGFCPTIADGELFREDFRYRDILVGPLTAEEVVSHLWRRNKVPEWINTMVYAADDRFTYFQLRCSGCFTALEHPIPENLPIPFALRIPVPPPGWRLKDERRMTDMTKSLEVNGKYEISFREIIPHPL